MVICDLSQDQHEACQGVAPCRIRARKRRPEVGDHRRQPVPARVPSTISAPFNLLRGRGTRRVRAHDFGHDSDRTRPDRQLSDLCHAVSFVKQPTVDRSDVQYRNHGLLDCPDRQHWEVRPSSSQTTGSAPAWGICL